MNTEARVAHLECEIERLEQTIDAQGLVIDVLSLMVTPKDFYRAKDLLLASEAAGQRIAEFRKEVVNRLGAQNPDELKPFPCEGESR